MTVQQFDRRQLLVLYALYAERKSNREVGRRLKQGKLSLENPLEGAALMSALAPLLARLQAHQIQMVFQDEAAFPPSLHVIDDPPGVLFYQGDLSLVREPLLSIVGTRRASPYGLEAAYDMAFRLAQKGVCIVSGLAKGIDASAHKGALDGGGKTIALLPCGPDLCYPPSHEWLLRRVLEEGLVLSEFLPGEPAEKWHFLNRNRLISALGRAVVVVQASERSGAVNTAQHAANQGKEVVALPGSIYEKASRGTHRLIQDGAMLLADIRELLDFFPEIKASEHEKEEERKSSLPGLGEKEQSLYLSIEDFGSSVEEIQRKAALEPSEVMGLLTDLEIEGYIEKQRDGRFIRLVR